VFVIGADNVGAREGISGSSTTAWNLVRLLGREKRRLMKDSKVLMNRGPFALSASSHPNAKAVEPTHALCTHQCTRTCTRTRASTRARTRTHILTRPAPLLRTPSAPPPHPLHALSLRPLSLRPLFPLAR
jgi:hypothetical protein